MQIKKNYCEPTIRSVIPRLYTPLMSPSANDEGIHYDGEGDDDDDPTAKQRMSNDNSWGDLW